MCDPVNFNAAKTYIAVCTADACESNFTVQEAGNKFYTGFCASINRTTLFQPNTSKEKNLKIWAFLSGMGGGAMVVGVVAALVVLAVLFGFYYKLFPWGIKGPGLSKGPRISNSDPEMPISGNPEDSSVELLHSRMYSGVD